MARPTDDTSERRRALNGFLQPANPKARGRSDSLKAARIAADEKAQGIVAGMQRDRDAGRRLLDQRDPTASPDPDELAALLRSRAGE